MKKSSFYPALMSIFMGFLMVTGCSSSPAPASSKNEPTIWERLLTRDANTRSFFLGEVNVNERDENGRTPLHYAAELGDSQLAAFFISIGADPNVLDNERQSPLGISLERNDAATTRAIAAGAADIHLPVKEGESAASMALGMNPAIFRAILTPSNIETVDTNKKNILHMAVEAGNSQGVRDILEIMPSTSSVIQTPDAAGKNALDYALERPEQLSHIEIAELLILRGAFSQKPIFNFLAPAVRSNNFNLRRNEGLAPIHFAVMNSYTGFVTFLLGKNIDINIKSTSGSTALHEAVRTGNIQIITMLLNAGADVNVRDGNNNTPLHVGTLPDVHREIAVLLLGKGADPNLRDDHGDTPLHITIILNRPPDVIQTFLGAGSDIHIRNMIGETPLYIAVKEGRFSIIPLLLSYGSEIFAADNSNITPFDMAVRANDDTFNLLIVPETVNQRDSAGNTMLHAAVRNRANPIQIARIIDTRSLVDARNRDGDTALHIAVRMNQRESAEFLISRGSNIFSNNSSGESPLFLALAMPAVREWIINPTTILARDGLGNNMLHYAAEWQLNNVIPVIIRNGLSVEEANATGETPIFMAVKTNSPSTITVLVDNNANLNARDAQGNSVLHTAVRWNSRSSAEFLISQRMDINAHSLNGNTPLHDSILFRTTEIEELLIRNNANLEVRNIDGNTPFMEAVRTGHLSSAERLSRNGADNSTRNSTGDTPLHIAVSTENTDMVNALLRMGASIHARNTMNRTPFQISMTVSVQMVSILLGQNRINISDDQGNSALHIAIHERASSAIIRTIINQGGRINTVDSNGKTVLRLAVDMENWEAAKIIADAGADPFIAAVDNRSVAEIAFSKGENCIRAVFSGAAVNSRDSSGNTILHIAAQYGNPQAISLLLELGANKTIRNISSEIPYDIAVRWNRSDNANLLR
ncbi:MAG: ankyrin repeat domain-containing protein [Treponema sp.]|nr:ankyrin repeat domain-containing protein [Treponema sp.]